MASGFTILFFIFEYANLERNSLFLKQLVEAVWLEKSRAFIFWFKNMLR